MRWSGRAYWLLSSRGDYQLRSGWCYYYWGPLTLFFLKFRVHELSHSVVSSSLQPMDCSLPGSHVLGILQARILEWVAMPSSRGSSQPRDRTQVPWIAGGFFAIWAPREALGFIVISMKLWVSPVCRRGACHTGQMAASERIEMTDTNEGVCSWRAHSGTASLPLFVLPVGILLPQFPFLEDGSENIATILILPWGFNEWMFVRWHQSCVWYTTVNKCSLGKKKTKPREPMKAAWPKVGHCRTSHWAELTIRALQAVIFTAPSCRSPQRCWLQPWPYADLM